MWPYTSDKCSGFYLTRCQFTNILLCISNDVGVLILTLDNQRVFQLGRGK